MHTEDSRRPMGQVIQIDEARKRDHLGEMVRRTVEETLTALLEAEADRLCGAGRYERSEVPGLAIMNGPYSAGEFSLRFQICGARPSRQQLLNAIAAARTRSRKR